MRYVKYAILGLLGVVLVSVALANRQVVTLQLLPDGVADFPLLRAFDYTIDLPLFAVIMGGVGVGLLIGFLWEWIREYRIRSEASRRTSEVAKLKREVKRLKDDRGEGKDDVLALLEDAS